MNKPRKAIKPQDLADQLQREAQARKLTAELTKALFNLRGLERLRDIAAETWDAAQRRDDEPNEN